MKLLVAIPALNEEASISEVVKNVKNDLPDATTLVIDDGSTDATALLAKSSGVKVISNPFNLGVGSAMRIAYKYAIANGYTHVLQVDADGQHLTSEAYSLIDAAKENAIVVGSRFSKSKENYRTNSFRRTAMVFLAFIVSTVCKTKLTDVTSGFRIASGRTIELFAREYPREYLGDTVESLIIAHHAGIEIIEVPVSMRQRQHGAPSQNIFKSTWHLLRSLLIIFLTLMRKKDYDKGRLN